MMIKTKIGQFVAEKAGEMENGQPIYRIASIPYAKAEPFMPPVLQDSFPQEKIINSLETFCFPQKRVPRWPNLFLKHHMMRSEWLPVHDSFSENAFMLNVWTSQTEEKKPVLVYIHGGGDNGSGTVPIYNGTNLAKHGIVVVTITYRVGLYGYLPIIENGTVNCNRAAKDQQTALRWIKRYIEYLGGDPDNITLMGQSGGALSSLNQILNQGNEGLIHKAILCGGSFMQARLLQEGRALYRQFLEENKLADFTSLAELTAKQIIRLKGRNAMAEVVDSDFFQESPQTALEAGHYQPIPLLIGFNDDEFSMIELPIYYKAMGIATKTADFQNAIEKKYGVYARELAAELEDEANGLIDLQIRMMEVTVFYSMNLYLLQQFSKHCPVYGYKFDYVPNLYRGLRGAYHGAEVAMFFDNLDKMNIKETALNKKEITVIQKDWLSFIKNGAVTNHSLYNEHKRVIHYSHPVKEIPFPHQPLIDRLAATGIFQQSMQDFLRAR